MHNRRDFLVKSLSALGVAAVLKPQTLFATPAPKKILILGGTGFVGPHQVRYALQRGHTVTIFNRGRSAPGMFGKDVEELQGDRANNLEALKGRKWDAVIDESASLSSAPDWVKLSSEVLKDSVDQYLFISTRSVYLDTARVPMGADAPVLTRENAPIAEGRPLTYGHAKAYAEKDAHAAMPGRVTVVRPGLIVGPEDDTDRFTYWPVRIQRGGEVLAPGTPNDPTQVIDARDLAEFIVRCCENEVFGTYNCTGPESPLTLAEMLGAIRGAMTTDAYLTWVDADFLAEQKVRPWGDMPVWMPPKGEMTAFMRRSVKRALEKGLTYRPLSLTAKDTLDFYDSEPDDRKEKLRAGLDPVREKEVLRLWHAKQSRR